MPSIDWIRLLTSVAISVGTGLVLYHALAGALHYAYYQRRWDDRQTWKIQPKKKASTRVREAAWSGTRNMAIGGLLSGIFVYAVGEGLPVPIFYDVATYGWAYVLGSTALYFVMVDFGAYHAHRILHLKPLYLRFHRYHHTFVDPTPHCATALHPVEFVFFQSVAFLPILVLPLHAASIVVVLVYVLVYNIVDHSGVSLTSWWPWQPPTEFHDDHHRYFHVNFGQHLMWWDQLFGTLRHEGRKYGADVFGGQGQGDATGDAVRYK